MTAIPATMLAGRLYEPGPVKIEEVATPRPAQGEVLIQVAACGVCGSDVHLTVEKSQFLSQYPRILGHEASGTVVALGDKVSAWRIGDRVTFCAGVSCGECAPCKQGLHEACERLQTIGYDRDGAYAQYIRLPQECLVRLPAGIPFDQGAILADAVATPYHALMIRGRFQAGETVAIFGCGGLGLHAVRLAAVLGASRVFAVDVRDKALEKAQSYGADAVIHADHEVPHQAIRGGTAGRGVDLAVEFVGRAETVEAAGKCLARQGRLVLVGIGRCRPRLPLLEPFVAFGYSVLGSFGYRRQDLTSLVSLMESGSLDLSQSISSRRPLEQLNQSLEDLYHKFQDPVRIIMEPNGTMQSSSAIPVHGP